VSNAVAVAIDVLMLAGSWSVHTQNGWRAKGATWLRAVKQPGSPKRTWHELSVALAHFWQSSQDGGPRLPLSTTWDSRFRDPLEGKIWA
jgi:hypothetical protein